MKVCPRCGAVRLDDHWVAEPDAKLQAELAKKKRQDELCPGDLRLDRRQVDGIVTLKGGFLVSHRDEIVNLINRVARDVRRRNVAARLYEAVEENSSLSIETTDEHLAERIGKEVERAFKGTLEIKWQKKDSFARVTWQRD